METILRKQGWILAESALKSMEKDSSKIESKNLSKTLLDRDLREIGAGISDLHKGKFENLDQESVVVLQILKVRNISAPKANESSKTAPQLLKLQLTDGVNTYSAFEMDSTPLSIDTKPGTKIALKVKHLTMTNGYLLLTSKMIEILGGNVEALVAKWDLTRSLAGMKGSRTTTAGGPPPFIPFGQKIQQQNLPNDQRNFKSLQPSKPKESENDDSEFKAQRQDAIAEASKAATKKTFGGGSKMLVDSNVQKIMDKGYTEEQATTALRYSRNNVEKALSNMKRREEHQQRANSNEYEPREFSKEKRGDKRNSAEPTGAKPSGAVSLFDFLENKIPEPAAKLSSSYGNDRFENNISSSFRKNDKDFSNNSQHWSQHSSEQKSSHNHKNPGGYGSRDYRDHGDGPKGYRDYPETRDSRSSRDGDTRRDTKYQSGSGYAGKTNPSNAPNQYGKSSSAVNNGSSSYNSRDGKGKYQSGGKSDYADYKPDYNSKSDYKRPDYNNRPDFNNRSDYNKAGSYQKDYNNFSSTTGGNNGKFEPRGRGNNSSTAPSKYNNDQYSNDYQKTSRKVVDSMEKMNLKGSHQPYKGADTKLNATNYPPLTPAAPEPPRETTKQKNYPKPGYPIVGFQNKEANEHAKNALKTKNISSQQQAPTQQQNTKPTSNWQQQQQPQQQPHSMPVNVMSQHAMKTQPPPPFPNSGVVQSAPPPLHTLPQPFVQHQPHHQVIHAIPAPAVISASSSPAVFHQTINYPTPIMMQNVSVPPPPGIAPPMNNLLKSGDLCLAKYWEDGQYYNAKITGVSESTYVVLFTEYGNAEEVRKTDCVPLIPACPTPPRSSFMPAPQMNASSYRIPAQKMPHHSYQQTSMPYSNFKSGAVKNQRN